MGGKGTRRWEVSTIIQEPQPSQVPKHLNAPSHLRYAPPHNEPSQEQHNNSPPTWHGKKHYHPVWTIRTVLVSHSKAVHFVERQSNFESSCLIWTLMNRVCPPGFSRKKELERYNISQKGWGRRKMKMYLMPFVLGGNAKLTSKNQREISWRRHEKYVHWDS